MPGRRVYILWIHPLFRDIMRKMLDHPSLEYVGSANNYDEVEDEINTLQPDILLCEETSGQTFTPGKFLAKAWDEMRIMGINLTDNRLHIYHKKEIFVRSLDDLLEIIIPEGI